MSAPVRGPGRPRSEQAENAILDAALEILVEDGAGRVSMEAIAARAGVGKATIYRRWKHKSALLVDAVMRVTEPVRPVHTDDLRADLITLAEQVRRKMSQSMAGRIMPRLMSAAIDDPELMQVYWEKAVLPRREMATTRLQEAIDAGELCADLEPDLLADMLFGPTVYRKLFSAVRPLPNRAMIEQVVEVVLAGARPDARPGPVSQGVRASDA
ncbi:MAG TPA: TetR/AcrR family transcriptional regulator [Mycobacteriales bacterium]|nr:TetR/AcrR family transcriptional regulator [Mycobacteriales bacterium]